MIIPCLFGKATACRCQNTEFETIAMQFMVWPTISTEQKLSEGKEIMQLWRLWLEEHTFQQCVFFSGMADHALRHGPYM
jgi:hypothetical protein